jgi:hypothetical protein
MYKFEPHHFVPWKAIGKSYCVKCGLVATHAPFTLWAIAKGCFNREHPSYDHARAKHTSLK